VVVGDRYADANDHTGAKFSSQRLVSAMGLDATTAPRATALARLASRRHGVVSREQLVGLGYGNAAIARLLRTQRLHRLHPGVFAVGHTALTLEGRLLAAVMACGPFAGLSHHSAAALSALRPYAGTRIHVTVPAASGRRSTRGLVVHRTRHPVEWTIRDGIQVTTPMRTLADLADTLPQRQLEKALERAHATNVLDVTAIDAIAERHGNGRRGPRRLQRLVHAHDAEATLTRSELEDALLALCDRYAIPRPRTNVVIDGHEADFAWPEHGLIVETDSWRHHSSRARFESDRRRDAEHIAAGWRVVRLTYARVTEEPQAVAALLRRLLAL
jgi:very-short-patch-repair endonuclease